jgi:hypothetical protein
VNEHADPVPDFGVDILNVFCFTPEGQLHTTGELSDQLPTQSVFGEHAGVAGQV